MKQTITTKSAADTEALGERIGNCLRGGETIELASDLGGGKTTFVRGLVRGAGSSDHVASPTFTLSREYDAGTLRMHHFDFYRLSEPGIMADELAEATHDDRAVVIVEWSDVVQHVLPEERLRITISVAGETSRTVELEYAHSLDYLMAEVKR